MQKLIMPFRSQMMLCGYKNPRYHNHWGYPHYGVDISTIQGNAGTDHAVYSSGEGIVVGAGQDNRLGYGVAILYRDCFNHKTGQSYDLIARYLHMKTVFVKVGDLVTQNTKIGLEGKEGTGDFHLHIEFDRDTKYPLYTPQVSSLSSFWRKGIDSTVNPSHVFHQADGRSIVEPTYNPEWLNRPDDFAIPIILSATNYEALYKDQLDINRKLVDKLNRISDITKED